MAKTTVTYELTFNPAANTLDMSAIPGFDVRRLYAVLDLTASSILYAAGTPGLGYTALVGGVMTLQASMAGAQPLDKLMCIYDDTQIAGFGAPNFGVGRAAISSPASLVVASRVGRRSVTIINVAGQEASIGPDNTVTLVSGVPLLPTAGMTIETQAAVYAATAGGGSATLAYLETY